MWSKFWRPTLFGTLATIVLFWVGAFFSAGGHNFALMMVFFPWAMMLTGFLVPFAWWVPFALLVALQFPVYGMVLSVASGRKLSLWGLVGLVALIHLLGVIWCFVFDATESWRILLRWT